MHSDTPEVCMLKIIEIFSHIYFLKPWPSGSLFCKPPRPMSMNLVYIKSKTEKIEKLEKTEGTTKNQQSRRYRQHLAQDIEHRQEKHKKLKQWARLIPPTNNKTGMIPIAICVRKVWRYLSGWVPGVKLEDIKGIIRIRKSKKDRQHNDQKKKYKGTNKGLSNTTRKTKDWATRIPLTTGR